jgi:hypothetical protein
MVPDPLRQVLYGGVKMLRLNSKFSGRFSKEFAYISAGSKTKLTPTGGYCLHTGTERVALLTEVEFHNARFVVRKACRRTVSCGIAGKKGYSPPLDFRPGEFTCLSLLILNERDWWKAQPWRSTGGRDCPDPRLA